MSLFKARDWWSTHVGEEEEFDLGCLCVGNLDNSSSIIDKIVVGSYHGFLRIFNPKPEKNDSGWSGYKPEDLLCETHFEQPILQLEIGRFVSGSDGMHLAVLHPRKLAFYSLSGTHGQVEHGTQYQLKLVHEHNLQRTAYNFCYGPFGGVKGKDFICVQSMDGTVSFFEQESFAFSRFLPGALLPGPIKYVAKTDSFVTVSSARQVECYKYQVLAVATDVKTKEESQTIKSGKRVASDWEFGIGEQAIDLAVITMENAPLSIFVLGERNLFILSESGKLKFMKKFEFNPSCFLPYTVENNINCLVATHTKTMMIYNDVTLKWAAQLANIPVQVKLANFKDLKGAVVTLDDQGHLACSYMGTDPAMFTAPTAEVREIDYAETDYEMKELQRVIKEQQNKTALPLPAAKQEDEIQILIEVGSDLDPQTTAIDVEYEEEDRIPSLTAKVLLKAKTMVSDVTVSVHVPPPVFITEPLISYSSLDPSQPAEWSINFFKRYAGIPAVLSGEVVVNFTGSSSASRVIHAPFRLPLKLVTKPVLPVKTATYKVTVDTNKPPVNLNDLFPDLLGESEGGPGNALGFRYYGTNDVVTVLASKTSQRYRLQCDKFENMWLLLDEMCKRLNSYYRSSGTRDFRISYDNALPLTEYFEVLDLHFSTRLEEQRLNKMLEERATQFRAVQRRLLTRFKDKTPAPLSNLDTLLNGTYAQLMQLADEMLHVRYMQRQQASSLSAATYMINTLIKFWQDLNEQEYAILEATLSPNVSDQGEQGWEEMVDVAITHLLRTCLAKSAKDQTVNPSPLGMLKDTQKLKKHIALLCDRLGKGAKLVVEGQPPVTKEKEAPPPSASTRKTNMNNSSRVKVPNLSDYSRSPSASSISVTKSSLDPADDDQPTIGNQFRKASKKNDLPPLNGKLPSLGGDAGRSLPPLDGPGGKFVKKDSVHATVPDLDDMGNENSVNGTGELVYGADEL